MRELQGLSYEELASALDVSVPAVKSLLLRARTGLVDIAIARDTPCAEIRDELISAADRSVRISGRARRHCSECETCDAYRGELRRVRRGFAALTPSGPLGQLGVLLGLGGGGGAAAAGGWRRGGRRRRGVRRRDGGEDRRRGLLRGADRHRRAGRARAVDATGQPAARRRRRSRTRRVRRRRPGDRSGPAAAPCRPDRGRPSRRAQSAPAAPPPRSAPARRRAVGATGGTARERPVTGADGYRLGRHRRERRDRAPTGGGSATGPSGATGTTEQGDRRDGQRPARAVTGSGATGASGRRPEPRAPSRSPASAARAARPGATAARRRRPP